MSGEKCSITCNVRNRKGNVEVSSLWDSLTKFFKGDRRNSLTHYFLTKDSNFLLENSDVLEFDVDGEVTIASLKKALERDGEYTNLSNARILQHLNAELGNQRYNYSEALDNVLKFNRSNQFRDGFMATLKRDNEGKYQVSVVERNPSTEYDLADHVANKILTDSIRSILLDKGLSVDFLDNPSYAVKYSTANVQPNADGLLAVAEVINGINSAPAVAEAAGHFIVASMEGTPLIDRLITALTPEVQMAIFKDKKSANYRPDFHVSDISAKEAAGILLGVELIQPFKDAQITKAAKIGNFVRSGLGIPKAIKYLLGKVAKFARTIFGKTKPEDVHTLVQRAKDAASTAAQGFINDSEQTDVSKAFDNSSTFTHFSVSKHLSEQVQTQKKAFYYTLEGLKDTILRLKTSVSRTDNSLNKDILTKLGEIVGKMNSDYAPQLELESFADNASIAGIIDALNSITRVLDTDVRQLLDSIQPSDRVAAFANASSNAANMRTLNIAIKNIARIYDELTTKLDSLKGKAEETMRYNDKDGNMVVDTLRGAVERLGDILVGNEEIYKGASGKEQTVHGLQKLVELKRRQIFIDAIRNFYGEDFINMNFGKVWQQRSFGRFSLVSMSKTKTIQDFVESLDEDISWFDRYLSSAADCGDFITAVGNKATKQANMQADRLAAQFWDQLEELRIQMYDAFGTTDCRPLYEVTEDENGRKEFTGNLVSRVNYGAWEKARKEFKEQIKKDFYNYLADLEQQAYEKNKGLKGYVFDLTDKQKGILYHNFVDPLWKQWHAEHSEPSTNAKGKKWIPNHVKYHNTQWDELFDVDNPSLTPEEIANRKKRLKWYEDLMDVKERMDAILPAGSTVKQRAPQLTGRFGHRFRNLRAKMDNSSAAFGHALRKSAQDFFVIKPDEAFMFGTDSQYCEVEEDPFENPLYFEKEKIDRLPIFGVHKLKNMEDLSTDLFGTLTQYGSMAATYGAMSQLVDIFEIGKDVIKHRKKGNQTEKDRDEATRAYGRYIKFVDKSVYGLNVYAPKFDRKGVIRKIANNLSSLGGKILLAGNVPGGIVNTGTGVFEILKEAMAGENFTFTEAHKANKMYFEGLLSSDGYFGTFTNTLTNAQRPMDKNSLWIRHWNILSENRSFLHNQKYDTKAMSLLDNRLWDWYNHMLMLPYSSGDHYMQTVPYYAMGLHEKVYTHDGRRIPLMDAYEVVEGEEVFASDDTAKVKGTGIGRNHKKIKLKEGVFKTLADIDKYDTAQKIGEKIANFFASHPTLRGTSTIALDIFSPEEQKFLRDEDLVVPTTVKQLESLGNALKSKEHEYQFNETNESEFMDKCRNICNRLHGIYNSEDKTTFQQNFYGNLVMSMRGYALGMLNRRYSNAKYNVPQGKVVEGSYNTAFKVLASTFIDINNTDNWKAACEATLMMTPLAGLPLFFNKNLSNKVKADMVKAGFTEHQYYNIRRTTADFLVLEALALLKLLASPGAHFGLSDDEDEDKNKRVDTSDNIIAGLLYYFTNRWFNEQGAFTWATAMWNEGNSLMDYVPAGFSGFKALFIDIGWLCLQTQFDKLNGQDLSNSELYYQSSKDGKYEIGDEKWWIKAKRLMPYVRSWYTLTHPYDATAGYEYGRKMRTN